MSPRNFRDSLLILCPKKSCSLNRACVIINHEKNLIIIVAPLNSLLDSNTVVAVLLACYLFVFFFICYEHSTLYAQEPKSNMKNNKIVILLLYTVRAIV